MVLLRPACEGDRRSVFSWLAQSDVTSSMLGPPLFPESAPPTWEEFCADYGLHFFEGTAPEREASYIIEMDGQSVGHIMDGALMPLWLRPHIHTASTVLVAL